MTHAWSARHTPCSWALSQCQCDIKMCAVKNGKMWRARCSAHTPRRLQQTAISCKRCDCKHFFLKKKTCESVTLSSLVRKRLQQVALFFDAAHSTSSEVIDFDEFMSSTSGHSTPTMMYWMKKTTNAIYDTGRKESVQVALLQTHGEECAYLLMLLGCLIGVSSVHSRQMCSARYQFFLISLKLLSWWATSEIFLCQLVHLDALLLGPTNY